MARKKKEEVVAEQAMNEQKYKGYQLLKLPQYDNRIGRIVLNPNEEYTFAEADNLIQNY